MEPQLHYRRWARIVLGCVSIAMWGWALGCVLTHSDDRALGVGLLALITVHAIRIFED